VRICKGKLFGQQLQTCDVTNKPNLEVILYFDLGYMDLSRLYTSFDYLSQLGKYVFVVIQWLGSPTFSITFTSVESKWHPLLKYLYDLNSKKFGLKISFDKLEPKHLANLIQCDPITCAQHYN